MTSITAHIATEHYRTVLRADTNELVADEPLEKGGTGKGFNPSQLLASSLGACTAITLRMYADRKNWLLREVVVNVSIARDNELNNTHIIRQIQLIGELDVAQKDRLMDIANKCEIHKILSHSIQIESTLI